MSFKTKNEMYNNDKMLNLRDKMEKPTRLALLKEIAEFLNEETEIYSMMQGALRLLINGSDFSTGWIFYIDEEGHHDLVSSVDLPEAFI